MTDEVGGVLVERAAGVHRHQLHAAVEIPLSDFDVPTDAMPMHSVEISLDELERVHGGGRPTSSSVDESSPHIELPTTKRHPIVTSVMRRLGEGAVDAAFVMASAWVRVEPAAVPASVRDFLSRERTRPRTAPTQRVTDRDFEDTIRDPGEKTGVGQLVSALAGPLRASQRRTPEDYGFAREHALGPSVPIVAAMLRAADLLGAPMPLVFALDDHPAIMARPPCEPIITVVNPVHCAALTPTMLDFLAAEHVSFFRHDRHARVLH